MASLARGNGAGLALKGESMKAIAFLLVTTLAGAAAAQDPKADGERAMREIEAFTNQQARTDPHYRSVEDELLKRVDEMFNTQPVSTWAATIRRWYFAASERAHSQERDRIRQIERAAAAGIAAPSPAAPNKYIDRMEALEKDLLAGKLSPREHALHALEAARAIFPADAHLIALREAKVALATDFELGNITRAQYDERWSRARNLYQQNAEARERAILQEMRAEQADLERRAGPSLGDRLRQQRGMRCTSTTAFGTTTTTCR